MKTLKKERAMVVVILIVNFGNVGKEFKDYRLNAFAGMRLREVYHCSQ